MSNRGTDYDHNYTHGITIPLDETLTLSENVAVFLAYVRDLERQWFDDPPDSLDYATMERWQRMNQGSLRAQP